MLRIATQNAYAGKDTPDALRVLAESGFNAVDLGFANNPIGKWVKEGLAPSGFYDKSIEEMYEYYKPIKEAGEKYGVEFFQGHAPFPIWVKDREDINEYMQMALAKCMEMCGYIGVKHLVVHSITLADKEAEIALNMELYRKLIPLAKKYHVIVCLENLFTGYGSHMIEGSCADVGEACRYIDTLNAEAGEECFGFCLDVGHANLLGRNLRKYINALGKRLKVLHIHDNDGKTDSHMMPYSQTYRGGVDFYTDWDSFIEGLRDIHYDGALSFETFRVLEILPKEVRPDALRMIASIGRYMKGRIEAPAEEA